MNRVYFATNRDPRPQGNPTNFGKRFSHDGLANLRFGVAEVQGRKVKVRTAPEKLKKPGESGSPVLGSVDVFKDLRGQMKRKKRDTVVFIHGYNVSFKEAVQSAAQLQDQFSEVGGRGVNVAVFSWPSDGSMVPWLAYTNDRRDAAASALAFARGILKLRDFLREMGEDDACQQRIHLVAHSMGNYVLRHALQEIVRYSHGTPPRLFDEIFLMAADEDDDAFEKEHKLKLLPKLAKRVHVYFNRGDRAMSISDRTKGNPDRLGDDGPRAPFDVPSKVTQIDCTRVVGGLVEHSYFIDTPKVVSDMCQVLEGAEPQDVAGRRFVPDRNRYELVEFDG
jgi:esterase/lipase superfamily enzyme